MKLFKIFVCGIVCSMFIMILVGCNNSTGDASYSDNLDASGKQQNQNIDDSFGTQQNQEIDESGKSEDLNSKNDSFDLAKATEELEKSIIDNYSEESKESKSDTTEVDTSEYYDFLLCEGDGYRLVAKREESVTDVTDLIGVLDSDYNWIVPLSSNTSMNPNGRIPGYWSGYNDFKHICEGLSHSISYAGDGIFFVNLRNYQNSWINHSDTQMLDVINGTWTDTENFRSCVSPIFNDHYFLSVDVGNDDYSGNVVIFDRNGRKQTNVYCDNFRELGQYSNGLFFSYDGFYDIDGTKVIDLSEYAGHITNCPVFQDGKCKLIAENDEGTEFSAIIDDQGNFISEFTKI